MAWEEQSALDARVGFIALALAGDETMADLCARHGISRKTGYKWLGRYHAQGAAGLAARASSPRHHGRALDAEVVLAALAFRERLPRYGPRKLRAKLEAQHPGLAAAAASTIGG